MDCLPAQKGWSVEREDIVGNAEIAVLYSLINHRVIRGLFTIDVGLFPEIRGIIISLDVIVLLLYNVLRLRITIRYSRQLVVISLYKIKTKI